MTKHNEKLYRAAGIHWSAGAICFVIAIIGDNWQAFAVGLCCWLVMVGLCAIAVKTKRDDSGN